MPTKFYGNWIPIQEFNTPVIETPKTDVKFSYNFIAISAFLAGVLLSKIYYNSTRNKCKSCSKDN
jgi:hypothetical protein